MKYNIGDLVVVDWEDSSGCSSWCSIEDSPMKPFICSTVGWVHSKKNSLYLYSERGKRAIDQNTCSIGSRNVIPHSCVKKVTVIKVKK